MQTGSSILDPSPLLQAPAPGPEASDPLDAAASAAPQTLESMSRLEVFHGFMGVFVVAFLVTLLATPIMRRIAVSHGVIDRPNDPRKIHRIPIAYMGGVAVWLGMIAGVSFSYAADGLNLPLMEAHSLQQVPVPLSVLIGMTVIMLAGLMDDLVGISPRLKIAGQLLAAAALAMQDVGVKVAAGLMAPIGKLIGNQAMLFMIDLPFLPEPIQFDLVYWVGTAIIAIFILGACNASNLIDGLDGLCSGVTGIAAIGLTFVALTLAVTHDGPLDSSRIVLCLCLLGACLGFLPHNFNPATIFLGDAGSLLLGYTTIAIILTLGDTGRTDLVVAGLIIYMIPIIDTTLAIVRRKLAGTPMSVADDQHLHHMLKRALGVKGAVFSLYAIGAAFAVLGAVLTLGRARVAYAIALVMASFIGVTAVKIARRKLIEEQAAATAGRARAATNPRGRPGPARSAATQAARDREPETAGAATK
jgi:UDP-GlcNAc:undecaprenyl-phosphate GlcNAc-1-phosphate transferase